MERWAASRWGCAVCATNADRLVTTQCTHFINRWSRSRIRPFRSACDGWSQYAGACILLIGTQPARPHVPLNSDQARRQRRSSRQNAAITRAGRMAQPFGKQVHLCRIAPSCVNRASRISAVAIATRARRNCAFGGPGTAAKRDIVLGGPKVLAEIAIGRNALDMDVRVTLGLRPGDGLGAAFATRGRAIPITVCGPRRSPIFSPTIRITTSATPPGRHRTIT